MNAPADISAEPMVRSSRGKRPGFFDDAAADQLMSMVMVLASEVSVLADQIDLMARAAGTLGVDLKAAMEGMTLDQAALEEREARRQAMLGRLFYLMRKEADEAAAAETAESYATVIADIAEA